VDHGKAASAFYKPAWTVGEWRILVSKSRASAEGGTVSRSWLEALEEHGVRYVIHRGELFYEDGEIMECSASLPGGQTTQGAVLA
jgi:hypothetical protein